MIISFFMPSVLGSRAILAGSDPATTAAACSTRPPAAPLQTKPASAPVMSASTWPAARLSWSMFTMALDARFMASITSGRSLLPPYAVVEPEAEIIELTPMLR